MRALRRAIVWILGSIVTGALLLFVVALLRGRPQDLPWTPLDLAAPVGLSTARKLVALGDDPARCHALLDQAGIRYTVLPARRDGATCGYRDAVRLAAGGARTIALAPSGLGTSCPVAAALAIWEWSIVQPAAQARFGVPVVGIDHLGSYACRRLYGRDGACRLYATVLSPDYNAAHRDHLHLDQADRGAMGWRACR